MILLDPGPASRYGLLNVEAWRAVEGGPVFFPAGHPMAEALRRVSAEVQEVEGSPPLAWRPVLDRARAGVAVFVLPPGGDPETARGLARLAAGEGLEVEAVFSGAPGEFLLELVATMAKLRAPGGCPWDREQTHESLARYLAEEAAEVLDAIARGEREHLAEELGDLLLQVVFHSEIAAEEGAFDIDRVARATVEKLVRRHPHVFGEAVARSPEDVVARWEVLKAEERGGHPGDLPTSLSALYLAEKVLRRLGSSAFGFPDDAVRTGAALAEIAVRLNQAVAGGRGEEAADGLVQVALLSTWLAQMLGVDLEQLLRRRVLEVWRRESSGEGGREP